MKKHYSIFFLLLVFCINAAAQRQERLDSLLQLIKALDKKPSSSKNDTVKINALNILGREVINTGDLEKADSLSRIALKLGEKNNFKRGIVRSLNTIGIVYFYKGEYTKALSYYEKALKLAEQLGDKRSIAANLGNFGIVYDEQGSYPEALDYYFRALRIYEELGDKSGIAKNLGNIGNVYLNQGDYDKALEYYFRSLKLAEEAGYKQAVANTLGNIGGAYYGKKENEKALEYHFRALKINEEIGDRSGISRNYGNIGIAYDEQGNFPRSLEYYLKALHINQDLGNKGGEELTLGNIGSLFIKQKKYREGEDYLNKALNIAKEIGDLDGQKEWLQNLSDLYVKQDKWKPAMEKYKQYVAARDSIFNEENTKSSVRAEMNFEFEKIAMADSVKNAEERKVKDAAIQAQEAQLKQERTQRYSLYGGLALVLVFSFFLFNRFKVTNRQKKEIEHQKLLVEEKNKEVMDSINYAKRIQEALLKEQEHVTSHLPEHFVLFKPKDIVSGDFYWGMEKQEHWYLCVADCTGHGVPGAFMSMLGIAYLNEINGTEDLLSPSAILDKLREKIVKELKQSGESGESKDGMDISLIRLNLKTNELEWAGANNPLWIIRQKTGESGILEEFKPDKQPIGFTINAKAFSNHTIPLHSGDSVYLFSDGYADQFGGAKGKKFKYKQLAETVNSSVSLNMNEQKQLLAQRFEDWKGKLEQVDDVLVIGVRV
ncbi:MAG: tetratricopeptide repeat protein [Bacteroidia bacterium]